MTAGASGAASEVAGALQDGGWSGSTFDS